MRRADHDAQLEREVLLYESDEGEGDDLPAVGDQDRDAADAYDSDEPPADATRARAHPRRWRLFLDALVFLSDVFIEIGRRALRFIELNVPRYVGCVDRCLVNFIRLFLHPRKQVSALGVLLTLVFITAIPYIIVTIHRIQSRVGIENDKTALSEEGIRPHIMIVRNSAPVNSKTALADVRYGGDGLRLDNVTLGCENTRQGRYLVADSAGYTCLRSQLAQSRANCCNESSQSRPQVKQYVCDRCDTIAPHCCDIYEHCVSCCMHPLNTALRHDFLSHADASHPVYHDPHAMTVFQFCKFRCRTSSASVQHENSYRRLVERMLLLMDGWHMTSKQHDLTRTGTGYKVEGRFAMESTDLGMYS